MTSVSLTNGRVAQVDSGDYERVSMLEWYAVWNPKSRTFYAMSRHPVDAAGVLMHRFIVGAPAGTLVDHQDHDGLNNTRKNLRLCSGAQNCHNRSKVRRATTSAFKGVSLHNQCRKWRARIWLRNANNEKLSRSLGLFDSEVKAALAYDAAAREHFGEFALTNFPARRDL